MYDSLESEGSDSGQPAETGSRTAQAKTRSAPLHRCAYCGKKFERASSPCMPFCSVRCHRADLGMWLTESYGLPWDGEADPEE